MTRKEYALITGGQLRNKGAQAMSFISVMELKRRFPELTPVLVSGFDAHPSLASRLLKGKKPRHDEDNLAFKIVHDINLKAIIGNDKIPAIDLRIVREMAREVATRGIRIEALNAYRRAALCIDISGFSFGDKWGYEKCMRYLDKLELLTQLDTPTYLLPQSYGPFSFDNSEQAEALRERSSNLLPKMRAIFARERAGLLSLKGLCPAGNCSLSNDLVLQNKSMDLDLVFKQPPKLCEHLPTLTTKTVGIVPNARNYDHGNKSLIDALYSKAMSHLLELGYDVALIRHAQEDLAICERLKSAFNANTRVQVYGEDRYCFEYGSLFSRCDFLIASRFHSIVHAYKCGVPCISLGWAEKYLELLDLVGQRRLAHDATSPNLDPVVIIESIDYVVANKETLRNQILKAVIQVQNNNVFDLVERDYRTLSH